MGARSSSRYVFRLMAEPCYRCFPAWLLWCRRWAAVSPGCAATANGAGVRGTGRAGDEACSGARLRRPPWPEEAAVEIRQTTSIVDVIHRLAGLNIVVTSRSDRGRDGRPATSARTARTATSPSWASTPGVRLRMQAQRTRDTGPEMAVRRIIHNAGLRYRIDRAPVPGMRRRADMIFSPAKVAVYIDGCFWHMCPIHGRIPQRNSLWWEQKLRRNRTKDEEADRILKEARWVSVRVWEHEDPNIAAAAIIALVKERRALR